MRKPPSQRPDDARGAEDGAEEALVLAPLRGGKRSAITVKAVEKIPALPRPCRARKTISSVMLRDWPERTEPARKRMTPMRTTTLRP